MSTDNPQNDEQVIPTNNNGNQQKLNPPKFSSEWDNINISQSAKEYFRRIIIDDNVSKFYTIMPFVYPTNITDEDISSFILPDGYEVHLMTSLNQAPLFYYRNNEFVASK